MCASISVLYKKLEFSTFYQIILIEMSQHRSDLLSYRNDNIYIKLC